MNPNKKNINQQLTINVELLKDLNSLIKKLKSSLEFQKTFIKNMKEEIYNFLKDKIKTTLIEKLLSVLPKIITQLGISFVYYFFNQEQMKETFFALFYDKYNENVSEIFKICLNIVSFSKNYDKCNELKNDLNDYGIIQKNEKEDNNKKIDMNPEQKLFEEILLMVKQLTELKNIGNIEILLEFKNEYNNKIQTIKSLKNKNILTKSQMEFYLELIKPCEEFLNSINENINDKQDEKFIEIKTKNDEDEFKNEGKKVEIDIPLDKRTFFYMNEIIKEERNLTIEFKNYKLPLDDNRNEIKEQLCSFLNTKGGRLYIGINEKNIVEGINLNYKKRDILRNDIVNLTYDFYPKCRVDKIFVYFIPIKEFPSNKFIQKKYIIKIRIFPGDPEVLYSTSNKGGYFSTIRKEGKCVRLTSEEIYKEIILREEVIKNLINDNKNQIILKENEIKDPEPEINEEDLENDDEDDNIPIFENYNINNKKKVIENNK